MKKLGCIRCGGLWRGTGSPARCPVCGEPSCAVVSN